MCYVNNVVTRHYTDQQCVFAKQLYWPEYENIAYLPLSEHILRCMIQKKECSLRERDGLFVSLYNSYNSSTSSSLIHTICRIAEKSEMIPLAT